MILERTTRNREARRATLPARRRLLRAAFVLMITAGIASQGTYGAVEGGPATRPPAIRATIPDRGGDPFFARWETLTVHDGLPSDKVAAVVVGDSGVWAGTEDGLALVQRAPDPAAKGGARWRVTLIDGLPFRVVSALAFSPVTGDLWIGTMGGLARLSGGRIDSYSQLDSGLANDVVYGVAVDGTDIWVATAAGLNRFDTTSGTWDLYDVTNTLMHEPWCYAVIANDGTVHVAVWGGGVIVRERGETEFRAHRDPDGEMEIDLFRDDGLVHDVTSGVAYDGGVLWVATYFGLSRYDGRRWRSWNQEDSGLAGDFINFIKAARGVLWVGTDQGLSRFDTRVWHTWRRTQSGGSRLIVTDEEDGRPARPARVLDPVEGPASNTIYGIDVDGSDIWLATAAGLVHGVGRGAAAPNPPKGGTTR